MICTLAANTELRIGELNAFAWLAILDEDEVARDEVIVDIVDNSDREGSAGGECAQLAPVTSSLLVVEVLRRLIFYIRHTLRGTRQGRRAGSKKKGGR
jgi:hypothetical protein